jgi:DNA repair exonuclease SbcCD nuclease subunit
MKILFIGDLHGSRENLELTRKSLEFCKALAIDKKVDRTVLLGDLHHVKANVRVEVQNLYLEAFKDWKNLDIIVGNHDYVNSKICEEHSLEIFKKFNNIRVIDKTIIDGDLSLIAESLIELYLKNTNKLY